MVVLCFYQGSTKRLLDLDSAYERKSFHTTEEFQRISLVADMKVETQVILTECWDSQVVGYPLLIVESVHLQACVGGSMWASLVGQ